MTTILVVDDTASFREPIAMALRLKGYQTVCAADGKQALDAARDKQPDLILLDVAMPEMDGMAFLKAKELDPQLRNIPVILLTAIADQSYVIQAVNCGVNDYILESCCTIDELNARVAKYLNNDANLPAATSQTDVCSEPSRQK